MPIKEAVEKLGPRSAIGSKLSSAEWSQVPVPRRERAFFSATIESARWLQGAQDSLGHFLQNTTETITKPDGSIVTALKTGGRAQFIEQMRVFAMAVRLGPLDPEDAGTIKDIRSEQRLGLIFDTQTKAANDYGNW